MPGPPRRIPVEWGAGATRPSDYPKRLSSSMTMPVHASTASGAAPVADDLHPLIWALFPPLMLIVVAAAAMLDPELAASLLSLDHRNGGLVEDGTVIVLLPGIAAGVHAVWRLRRAMPSAGVRWWLVLWTLGAAYFALEEISWGQWLFGWESPEPLVEINKQNETNLHNISPWLDRKPRVLLEWWIILAGLLFPAWRLLRRKPAFAAGDWRGWVLPSYVCLPSAALYLAVRALGWLDLEAVGHTELREYQIAVFISVYLLSCWWRLRGAREARTS